MAPTCGHEGCNCEAGDSGYCSDYCQHHGSREGHTAHDCGCSHDGCR